MKLLKPVFMLLNISTIFLFLNYKKQFSWISFAIALVFYFLSSVVHSLIHEFGHFFGGIASGYRPLFLQLSTMNIIFEGKGCIYFSVRKTYGGQCVMFPEKITPIKFKAYNLGGIFANTIVALPGLLFFFTDSIYWSLLFIELMLVGLYKVLLNSVPHKRGSVFNDGYVYRLLKGNDEVQKDYANYLQLYSKVLLKEEINPDDFNYERSDAQNSDEMIYYNEIKDILKSLEVEKLTNEVL